MVLPDDKLSTRWANILAIFLKWWDLLFSVGASDRCCAMRQLQKWGFQNSKLLSLDQVVEQESWMCITLYNRWIKYILLVIIELSSLAWLQIQWAPHPQKNTKKKKNLTKKQVHYLCVFDFVVFRRCLLSSCLRSSQILRSFFLVCFWSSSFLTTHASLMAISFCCWF